MYTQQQVGCYWHRPALRRETWNPPGDLKSIRSWEGRGTDMERNADKKWHSLSSLNRTSHRDRPWPRTGHSWMNSRFTWMVSSWWRWTDKWGCSSRGVWRNTSTGSWFLLWSDLDLRPSQQTQVSQFIADWFAWLQRLGLKYMNITWDRVNVDTKMQSNQFRFYPPLINW